MQKSTVTEDYFSLVNNPDGSDVCFLLNDQHRTKVYGHRALILFRLIQRELYVDANENMSLGTILSQSSTPDFIRRVSSVVASPTTQVSLHLGDVHCASAFLSLLEFLYCDRFMKPLSCLEIKKVAEICGTLKLTKTYQLLRRHLDYAKAKIQAKVLREL